MRSPPALSAGEHPPRSSSQPNSTGLAAEANTPQGGGLVLPNWDNLENLRGGLDQLGKARG